MAQSVVERLHALSLRIAEAAGQARWEGYVSRKLFRRLSDDRAFFVGLAHALEPAIYMPPDEQAVAAERAGRLLENWLAAGGCSWMRTAPAEGLPN